jgi:hypothetical protein
MSLITNMFYGQNSIEIQASDYLNNILLKTIPSLVGKDYFFSTAIPGKLAVICKIDNNYTYYDVELGRNEAAGNKIVKTRSVTYKPVLDKIFTNFVPKAGVKRYLSDYGDLLYMDSFGAFYIAIYKNGVKTFGSNTLSKTVTNRESPIDEDISNFILINLHVFPDKL